VEYQNCLEHSLIFWLKNKEYNLYDDGEHIFATKDKVEGSSQLVHHQSVLFYIKTFEIKSPTLILMLCEYFNYKLLGNQNTEQDALKVLKYDIKQEVDVNEIQDSLAGGVIVIKDYFKCNKGDYVHLKFNGKEILSVVVYEKENSCVVLKTNDYFTDTEKNIYFYKTAFSKTA
jgi:hypothetical protein